MDKKKILNMLIILAAIMVIVRGLTNLYKQNSISLTDYMSQKQASDEKENEDHSADHENSATQQPPQPPAETPFATPEPEQNTSELTGAILNGQSQQDQRIILADGFYYEPVSDALRRYMTGVSYFAENVDEVEEPAVSFEELRYVHILHYGFDGLPTEGELICNESIAQDIMEIFYELYRNEYKLGKVLLIDEYDGDYIASMTDNNTFCFGVSAGEENADFSKHAAGLAIDINPLYNPCVTYEDDETETVSPDPASVYADRSLNFPYKIDETDLCYKLFAQYGFTWGGNLNDRKAYQHFQKINH